MTTPPPRGTAAPTGADSPRDRILAAAAATLSARGYTETKLSDIALRAGLKPPAIYYYFASRETLIAAALQTGQQRVREHVEAHLAALDDDASPMDRICAATEAHLVVELEQSSFATAVTRNAGHVPPTVREILQRDSDAYHDLWRGLLEDARLAGVLAPQLDESMARLLVIGALNWAAEWWSPERPIDDLVTTAQTMVRQALTAP